MLLDRAQSGGDLADADAACTLLTDLRGLGGAEPDDLGELLRQAGPPQLGELLTVPAAGSPPIMRAARYRLDLDAAAGSARLIRGILAGGATTLPSTGDRSDQAAEDLRLALMTLRSAADSLPAGDHRRPDVLSDLGLALLATGREAPGPATRGGRRSC